MSMNEVIAMNISNLLKSSRKKQQDLADALNMPKQTISKMLNGARMISAPELSKIANYFSVSMDSLVQKKKQIAYSPIKLFMGDKYDIFLSHSSKDNLLINALYYELINMGFSVFLDKKDADKTSIDDMAEHLKKAMKKSTYLLYVHTHNASLSKWTPWEIGYFDSRNKSSNILIMPTLDDSLSMASYRGQEYLTQYNGICVEGLENLRNLLHKIKKIYG